MENVYSGGLSSHIFSDVDIFGDLFIFPSWPQVTDEITLPVRVAFVNTHPIRSVANKDEMDGKSRYRALVEGECRRIVLNPSA